MKKALLLVCILSISVITTACINNLAVQELNNKAAVYMEKGNYAEAIERLKSSIDLDDSLYATHYNLAVAYTNNNEYQNAINSFRKVIELNPDFAEAYYSLAVAEENVITDIYSGVLRVDGSGNVYKPAVEELEEEEKSAEPAQDGLNGQTKELSVQAKTCVDKLVADAVKNYETYLQKGSEINDRTEVQARIDDLKSQIESSATEVSE